VYVDFKAVKAAVSIEDAANFSQAQIECKQNSTTWRVRGL